MPAKPCLSCGVLSTRTRCRPCELAHQRNRNRQTNRALYTGTYAAFRRQALAHATHCAKCGHELVRSATAANGATYDHATDSVLCRSCNSSQRRNAE